MGVDLERRELLVADTSFVSLWQASDVARASLGVEVSSDVARRITGAELSISVVTVAELRAGHLKARWGERRRAQAERWLRQFSQVTVDRPVADAWAALKDASRRHGRVCSENDLWIAATGWVRDAPVVTCDRDFLALRTLGVEVIYVPRRSVGVPARR